MPEPIKPEDIPAGLVGILDRAARKPHSSTGAVVTCLAEILTVFDQTIRAEIVRWIEAQMHDCPKGHDRDTGHRAQCNWCWHNSALRNAANLARGNHGSTTAYALHRMAEGEQANG